MSALGDPRETRTAPCWCLGTRKAPWGAAKGGHAGKPGFLPGPTGLQPGFPGEFLALKPTTYGSKQKETLTRSTPRGVGGFTQVGLICHVSGEA